MWLLSVHAEDDYNYDYDDHKCNKTESIIGGTVQYSKDGSEVTYNCNDGFTPFPISKKVCNSKGKWEPEISRVICEGQVAVDDIKKDHIKLAINIYIFIFWKKLNLTCHDCLF